MKNVLITAIGGDIAQNVAAIVRETYPDWRLIGTDIHDRHGGALFVDTLHRGPAASHPEYGEWLSDLIQKEQAALCIPMSEAELRFFLERRQENCGGVRLVMPSLRAIEIGTDKLETAVFLDSIGCPGPWTVAAEVRDDRVTLPCIFKPRRSSGSKTIFVCRTAEELAFYRERYVGGIFQELLLPADKEVTCAIFRAQTGDTIVLQLLRTLVGGFTGWAQVIDDRQIADQCKRLAEAMDLRGSINVQLRVTEAGPRIFEINARFSSTVLMRHQMGFRDVVWALQDMMQQRPAFYHPEVGTIAVRVQGAMLLPSNSKEVRYDR